MKIFTLILSFLMPDTTWATIEDFNTLINENEVIQRQLATTLEITKVTTKLESSSVAEKLPQSQVADAEINIMLKASSTGR